MAMKGSVKVLVDTSVWIDYFLRREPAHSRVSKLLTDHRVCTAGLVVAELMQGARSEKEMSVIRDFVHVFDFLPEGPGSWLAAGELSFKLRRGGKSVGLADCYLAVLAKQNGAAILTHDRHFDLMRKEAGIRLMDIGEGEK